MKIKILILCLFLTSVSAINAQASLEIKITNLKNNEGYVAIDLLDKNNKSVKSIKGKIVNMESTLLIPNLKHDKYAIRFFHDENLNEKIDKNIIGIPKEGFGFSNDGMGKFGPKDFEEWLFDISGDTKITLITKYY